MATHILVIISHRMADTKGKRVEFDIETWHALDQLARSRIMTFQELADEAFRDLMKKHGLPYDTRDAFRRSAAAAAKANQSKKPAPKKKRPARRRAR
jgi:hypothetical protein